MLFYESLKNWEYYVHVQTVCTRPLLWGEGSGNEAKADPCLISMQNLTRWQKTWFSILNWLENLIKGPLNYIPEAIKHTKPVLSAFLLSWESGRDQLLYVITKYQQALFDWLQDLMSDFHWMLCTYQEGSMHLKNNVSKK